jgi:hypothetical protein
MRRIKILALSLMVAMSAIATTNASADTVSINFEGPTYNLGAITNGEGGWQVTSPAYQQAVTATNPISGAQSWVINSQFGQGSFGDQPFSPALAQAAGENAAMNFFEASMKFMPMATQTIGDGVTLSTDNGTGQRMDWLRIDYSANNTGGGSWNMSMFDYNGAAFVQTGPTVLNANQVYDLKYTRKFNAGLNNDEWKVYLNNALLFTGVGWEDFFVDGGPTYGPSPVTVDRILFRNSASVAGSNGVMFDDITYTSSNVPEPMTLTLFGFGLVAVARRFRRSA